MKLNLSRGDMYPWIDYTGNAVKGRCPHQCCYCYNKQHWGKPLRLVETELRGKIIERKWIFIGSSCDMWADEVPDERIEKILKYLSGFTNMYFFQSKNPKRFLDWHPLKNQLLGTTIETNRNVAISGGQSMEERAEAMRQLDTGFKTITVEPVMDFDLKTFLEMLKSIRPAFISIGAYTGPDEEREGLSEPSPEKLKALLEGMAAFTEVKEKDNLSRLLRVWANR